MSKRSQKRSFSQTLFWVMSILLAASMVISLFAVALIPSEPAPTATPVPTWTPWPTRTPTSTPTETSTHTPTPTEEPIGPSLPTGTGTPDAAETPAGPSPPTDTPAPASAATGGPANALAAAAVTALPSPTFTLTQFPTFAPTPVVTFTSKPTPSLVFAVAGDSRNAPDRYRRVLNAVAAGGHEFLIHTGDLVNKGTEAEWQTHNSAMEGFPLPYYPVPGNHDGLDGRLDGYLTHTGVPAHYSFDRGPVHFTMADSHHGGISAAELGWIRQDLEGTDRPVTIVVLHHPPFDPDGSDHIMAYGNESFIALMREMDVDIVFAGHIHAYVEGERDGVRYYITGGAGAPLYGGHQHAYHHYLRVTVLGTDVTVEAVKL